MHKIEIKYNIGDKVFFLHENKIHESTITNYTAAQIIGQPLSVKYSLKNKEDEKGRPLSSYSNAIPEALLFESKEELIKSL